MHCCTQFQSSHFMKTASLTANFFLINWNEKNTSNKHFRFSPININRWFPTISRRSSHVNHKHEIACRKLNKPQKQTKQLISLYHARVFFSQAIVSQSLFVSFPRLLRFLFNFRLHCLLLSLREKPKNCWEFSTRESWSLLAARFFNWCGCCWMFGQFLGGREHNILRQKRAWCLSCMALALWSKKV